MDGPSNESAGGPIACTPSASGSGSGDAGQLGPAPAVPAAASSRGVTRGSSYRSNLRHLRAFDSRQRPQLFLRRGCVHLARHRAVARAVRTARARAVRRAVRVAGTARTGARFSRESWLLDVRRSRSSGSSRAAAARPPPPSSCRCSRSLREFAPAPLLERPSASDLPRDFPVRDSASSLLASCLPGPLCRRR